MTRCCFCWTATARHVVRAPSVVWLTALFTARAMISLFRSVWRLLSIHVAQVRAIVLCSILFAAFASSLSCRSRSLLHSKTQSDHATNVVAVSLFWILAAHCRCSCTNRASFSRRGLLLCRHVLNAEASVAIVTFFTHC